jgi:1-deoxy-D-xylulose-5-phosphate reductoisomerase
MKVQGLSILGASGSIGQSTLDVVRRHPDRYRVVALTAHRQIERLAADCREFRPQLAVVGSAESARALRDMLLVADCPTRVEFGPQALVEAATLDGVDAVMAAIVGAAGLPSALAAAHAGKKILLANKEALVMAGPVFMRAVETAGAVLLPIDSEHNAVFQALPQGFARGLAGAGVTRIVLTASGGPFRDADPATLADVTPEQAVAHPNWSMGRKISVDSATMMNKGLEVIEAHFLFGLPAERIDVVIHPQSVVHSMAEYIDGSVLAELGNPDMRTPIAHALAWPERIVSGVGPLDLVKAGRLDFSTPDLTRFPCLALAYRALQAGGSAPAVLNAANEVAVEAFLDRRIRFTEIAHVVAGVLGRLPAVGVDSLDEVLAADTAARRVAEEFVTRSARC